MYEVNVKATKDDILIVVDMQHDFIDGSLANPLAENIVEPMGEFIKKFPGKIIFTVDTHDSNYLNTSEGKHLPIVHCIYGTSGWNIVERLSSLHKVDYHVLKDTFGAPEDIMKAINIVQPDLSKHGKIYICGTCTEICVVSNALGLKTLYPETPIIVIEDLCAALSDIAQKMALYVMGSCQCEVKFSTDIL